MHGTTSMACSFIDLLFLAFFFVLEEILQSFILLSFRRDSSVFYPSFAIFVEFVACFVVEKKCSLADCKLVFCIIIVITTIILIIIRLI